MSFGGRVSIPVRILDNKAMVTVIDSMHIFTSTKTITIYII